MVVADAMYKNRQLFLLLFLLKIKPGPLVFMQVYLIYWDTLRKLLRGLQVVDVPWRVARNFNLCLQVEGQERRCVAQPGEIYDMVSGFH